MPPSLLVEQKRERPVVVAGRDLFERGPVFIAGPCAVESEAQALRIARAVKAAGATVFRGGAYKPRTSPYSFQGLGETGLEILARVRAETGLLICTEAVDGECLPRVAEVADIVQIGSRNMDSSSLLKKAGRCGRPVLLKRGFAATLDELLHAAEYIHVEGNADVILCERGIRTFSGHSRNTLDLHAVLRLRERTSLPVMVDPSHAPGLRADVVPLACAAAAVGADGVIVEVHDRPEEALSDGPQQIEPASFARLVRLFGEVARLGCARS